MSDQINLFDAFSDYYEMGDSDIDINKLNFKVHASLIYKLGESLIADEITALSELMKNSYDADASFCKLTIDPNFIENNKIGKITVSDNGCGMDLQTIISGWLTISNSPKKKMKKNNETTAKYHRIPLGEKGLGRLSVQKLGRKVDMITKKADSSIEYTITIPWNDFLKNTTLDQVNILCNEKVIENSNSYTKIIITDLINPDYWTKEENVKGLEKTISRIISPFRFNNNNFVISASVGEYKIDVKNTAFNDILNTARCIYSIDVSINSLKLKCQYKLDFFKRRRINEILVQGFDYQRDYFEEMYNQNKDSIEGWRFDLEGDTVFEIVCDIPFASYSGLKRSASTGEIIHPGLFKGKIFDFYYDKEYLSALLDKHSLTAAFTETEYTKFVKDNKGIKVVRDGFVVQGYADGNSDWLNLSASATTSGKFADINNESVIGYIELTGEKNSNLKETTSREGFISDDYYFNFFYLLREISIRKINQQNQKLMKIFTEYLHQFNTDIKDDSPQKATEKIRDVAEKAATLSKNVSIQVEQHKTKVNKMIETARFNAEQPSLYNNANDNTKHEYEKIINEQKSAVEKIQNEFGNFLLEVENLKSQIVKVQFELENYNKRISDVFELAGLGISVELFTHEMYTTINNVNEKIRTAKLQTDEMRYVYNSMNSLRKQLSYFHPGLKYVRLNKQVEKISLLIENHMEFYQSKAELAKIKMNFINNEPGAKILLNIGLFYQVLDNLFSNSYYWLQYSRDTLKEIDQCEYNIELFSDGSIDIWDNGIGISRDIENDLFNPFVSCKESGRGLGLFICKNNLENNSSSIRLLRIRNPHGNLFKFHIDLSNLIVK